MKKILVSTLIAIMIGATFTACGNTDNKQEAGQSQSEVSTVSAKDIVDKLNEEEYVRMPIEIDDTMAKEVYHLNLDDIEDYGILETGISPGPGFILVVKAKEGKVEDVKASVEQVLQDKIGSAFYPEEKEIAESAKVEVNGDLVSLFIVNSEISSDAAAKYSELIK